MLARHLGLHKKALDTRADEVKSIVKQALEKDVQPTTAATTMANDNLMIHNRLLRHR